ncbi:ATP-dependent Clp protease ATP-binding subunit ClpX [Striga asiatica]|uniref:ATP-dependent Clp protease ATP-binding subunit ClpX n=1 Tax=Striga asiatica TaxID=4170 RepID=A0A5A7P953_STRAF|nr:ATP-dependent Clp protease ATP-binding subunit ClpX [Striga asiatica]
MCLQIRPSNVEVAGKIPLSKQGGRSLQSDSPDEKDSPLNRSPVQESWVSANANQHGEGPEQIKSHEARGDSSKQLGESPGNVGCPQLSQNHEQEVGGSGKEAMIIEETQTDKVVPEVFGQRTVCTYNLRKKPDIGWRRRVPSQRNVISIPETSCTPHEKGYWLVFVYLSTDRRERNHQWEFLEASKVKWGQCWMIAGDWNDIMHEVAQKGSFYTWGNNRANDGYVEERLDKIFVSYDWLNTFPNMEASNYYRSASDHNILFIDTDKEIARRHKRFSFSRQWAVLEGVQDAVQAGWTVQVEGSYMFQVHQKVKSTRMALLAWHKPQHRNSERIISATTAKNGQTTRINEVNWVPGVSCRKPELRVEVEGNLFWVKDLLSAGGMQWDHTLGVDLAAQIAAAMSEHHVVCFIKHYESTHHTVLKLYTIDGMQTDKNLLRPTELAQEGHSIFAKQITDKELFSPTLKNVLNSLTPAREKPTAIAASESTVKKRISFDPHQSSTSGTSIPSTNIPGSSTQQTHQTSTSV